MATPAIIKIEGSKVVLYKHWDGYPESTLQWLEDFNKNFNENRGDDIEYKVAQLIRSSISDAEKYNLDDSKFTGWGVFLDGQISGDWEYILTLTEVKYHKA